MKLQEVASILNEAVVNFEQSPEVQQLRQLLGDQVANDALTAWNGDQRDYQRSGGKNFDPLVPRLLNPDVLSRKYNIRVTPAVQSVLSRIVQLARQTMPDTTSNISAYNARFKDDVWGHERFAREGVDLSAENALYEALGQEVDTLLKTRKK